ncbi:hypothetical protein AM587_10014608 [Phytophthora nicotianae]|uniref:26S protease regulatory subunit 10B A n=1 Tax=Phytophthora nicotianae TaxID=4792 RepID=A0A0W8DIH6_PHYNI|nr:hypothetical protein AM587_10014608 [Phytophthora nicotianae]KUF96142.1 26S protease regulatory subunit 10B A [Phytophthora nicotianae]
MTREDSYKVTKRRSARLPRWEFAVVWLVLMTLHALCAAYLLAMARLYFFMENPNMAYISNLLAFPEQRKFRLFGTFVGILGGLHTVQLVLHIASSIHARALVVWPRDAMITRLLKFIMRYKPGKTSSFSESKSRIHNTAMRTLTAIEKALSVQGSHFEFIFVLRKAVEVAAQIYQCYNYSTLISRVWINQAFVAMTVINCLVTPILNHLMLASASRAVTKVSSIRSLNARIPAIRERTLCVTVDTLLTAISSLAIPLAIFIPWAHKFDPNQWTFPSEILYDDTMYTRLIYENQSIFALSIRDSLLKVIPHGSLLLGLASISFILEKNPVNGSSVKKNVSTAIKVSSAAPQHPPEFSGLGRLQDIAVFIFFLVVSTVVLALHIRADMLLANANSCTAQMCEQSVRPWFAQNVSCSVVKFNCYRQGVASPAEDALGGLERNALASIIFEHCSEFRMTSSIREFPNLLGLELWNVTIVNWGIEAALNANLHPKMGFLVMVRVNMTELPEGVLTTPLPYHLTDFEIVLSNLSRIPDAVSEAWINAETLYFEHASLETFPTTLFCLPVVEVSLVNNNLKTLPDDLFSSDIYPSFYTTLALSYNPLPVLPEAAKESLIILELWLPYTTITTLPSWTVTIVGDLIEAGNSPVCEDDTTQLLDIVECSSTEWNPLENGFYPLSFVEPTRQL